MKKEKPTYEELEKRIQELEQRNKLHEPVSDEQKQAERILHQDKLFFDKLLDVAIDTFFVFDPVSGKPIRWNKSFSNISGYNNDEIAKMKAPSDFYDETDIGKAQQYINKILNKEQGVVVLNLITKQGKRIPFEYVATIFNDDSGNTLFLSIGRNISERTQNEQSLTQAKEKAEKNELKLKEAQKLAKIGNWELDLINNKLTWSDEIYRIFGCEPQEFGATYDAFLDFIHPDDRDFVNNSYLNHIKSKEPYNLIHRILLANNEIKYVNERCNSDFDKKGNALRSIGTVADITENIMFQNELQEAKEKAEESDRLKIEFINNMSHEIRTPMNGILGFSGFLDDPNLTDTKRKQYTNIIKSSGNQLMQIIDDILEISKLGTRQVKIDEKEVCINDLLLELFLIFDIKAKENKIPMYLKKELSDKESTILTDKTKLIKILSNLLENALKFTREGFIELGYQLKTDSEPVELTIYVKDTGIGIKKENQETIFIKFSQEEKSVSRNVGGLGLGLSIANENTTLLGGNITLQSEKGKGSTFFVAIPYKPVNAKINNSNADKTTTIEKQDKYTILIVEDEEVNHLYLETLLEYCEINFKTIHAKHGKEAVEMCKENSEIDFVLMDMKMPIMTGFEATKLIKEFRPNLPIVAQTAYSTKEEKEQAISAGCDDFISKPISEKKLNEIINKYLIIK
jgi:PAS domain S-box-containing protein